MILHITLSSEWRQAQAKGEYFSKTLAADGFIHCSAPEQVVGVTDDLFRGKHGLVLLCIDEKRLRAEVKWEDLYDCGKEYPHVYGPINLDAVIRVVDFSPNEDGTISLPEDARAAV